MKENVHPLDIVFRLAEDHGIVLLTAAVSSAGLVGPGVVRQFDDPRLRRHRSRREGMARGYRQAYEASGATRQGVRRPRRRRVEPKSGSATARQCGSLAAGRHQSERHKWKTRAVLLSVATLAVLGGLCQRSGRRSADDPGAADRRHHCRSQASATDYGYKSGCI